MHRLPFLQLVRDGAKLRMPRLQRRMNLIQTKSEQEKHSDYLDKSSNLFSVAEYEQMSGGELQIYLFIESADPQMARMVMELLENAMI